MDEIKTQMRYSVFELDRIIIAILENVINLKFVQNVRNLFNMFSASSYMNDEDKVSRVMIVRELCTMIIDKGIQSKDVILNTISFNGRFADKEVEVLNSVYNQTIPERELLSIDEKVSLLLKFATIEQTSDMLINTINNIKSDNYTDLSAEISAVENEVNRIQKNLKDYRESVEEANNSVSLDSPQFLSRLNKIIEEEKNPSNTIRTGIKLFNEILDGGFKSGRLYCCLAPMKNFKSGLLLLSSIWAKKYNNIKAKDPTKKPVVLYITLENSVDETIKRMASYCEGNSYKLEEHTLQESARVLEAHGLYSPNDSSDVGIEVVYKPNRSITVGDISVMIDDYDKAGKEVVFLAVDYIKRIRPSVITKDLRLDLSDIANELHDLAVAKGIPVLTAMQLNRGAISEMDNAETFAQKIAAFGRIGASNVSESIDIVQNVDLAFTMVKTVDPKIDESGNVESVDKYLNFKIVASRYTSSDIDSFVHRFKNGNDMALEEDADASVSRSIVNKNSLLRERIAENGIKTRGPRHV